MKFEEALELMKQGKKIRRNNNFDGETIYWIENDKLYKESKSYKGEAGSGLSALQILATDWGEYKEPLLTKEEKEFLKMIIKFNAFELSKVSIDFDDEYANEKFIRLYGSADFGMTAYVKSNYFKNLEENNEYTLEELGLDE